MHDHGDNLKIFNDYICVLKELLSGVTLTHKKVDSHPYIFFSITYTHMLTVKFN